MLQALSGLKVLDLSTNLPGPYMTWLMACLGAEVVKIENPVGGDLVRGIGGGGGPGAAYFKAVNRGKRSLALNLKSPEGKDILLRLLAGYDTLVEGFRPGVMQRLGLDFPALSRTQPRLIQVSITGYGHQGDYALRAGHDVNYLALAGVLSMTGSGPGQTAIPGVQVADLFGGSLLALAGCLAAVIQRQTTGKGQFVDAAMFDGSLSLSTMVGAGVAAGVERAGAERMVLNGRVPCYRLYSTSDGKYMSLGALEPKFWQNLCAALERPDLTGSQFGGEETIEEVARIFASKTQAQWTEFFTTRDCCCEPVLELEEALASPLAAERCMVSPQADGLSLLAPPFKLSTSPLSPERPSPGLGEHSRDILASLGFSRDEAASLRNRGVVTWQE